MGIPVLLSLSVSGRSEPDYLFVFLAFVVWGLWRRKAEYNLCRVISGSLKSCGVHLGVKDGLGPSRTLSPPPAALPPSPRKTGGEGDR